MVNPKVALAIGIFLIVFRFLGPNIGLNFVENYTMFLLGGGVSLIVYGLFRNAFVGGIMFVVTVFLILQLQASGTLK